MELGRGALGCLRSRNTATWDGETVSAGWPASPGPCPRDSRASLPTVCRGESPGSEFSVTCEGLLDAIAKQQSGWCRRESLFP